MSTYSGWAIRLINGKFANDNAGNVACAAFTTRREALAWRKDQAIDGKVVKVTIAVREAK